MKGSKSTACNSLTAERLQRIIKNIRSVSTANDTLPCPDIERHKKLDKADSSSQVQLKISCRKLTAYEIDKLINCLPTTQSPPCSSECSSVSTTEAKQQVNQEAPEPSISNGPLQVESEISFSSKDSNAQSHSTLELPADIEDNLAHSNESLFSSFGAHSPTNHASSQLNSSSPPSTLLQDSTSPIPVTLFTFRPIEPVSSEEYESYGETSRSDNVDRPIMQVKVRPLASALQQSSLRPAVYRFCRQQSDDEQPLIDFRQIERNTRAAARKALVGGF